MRVQTLLCIGALGGATFIAAPVLSQDSPSNPRPQTPPGGTDSPRQPTPHSTPSTGKVMGQMQALNALVGTWDVSVKTFAADGGESAQNNPASQTKGTSTRTWILDNKILQEEVQCGDVRTMSRANSDEFEMQQTTPPRPGTPPGRPDMPPTGDRPDPQTPGRDMMHQPFQGHGMFGFDSHNGQFEHVWADSHDSKLTMSLGRYDESSKTFTFMVNRGPGARVSPSPSPSSPNTPGKSNPDNQDQVTPGNQPRPNQPPGQPGQPGQPGPGQPGQTPPRTPSPGMNPPASPPSMADLDHVVIRIQGEDRHIVEYYKAGTGGPSTKFMEITYTKSR